jgi:hypothetical protein
MTIEGMAEIVAEQQRVRHEFAMLKQGVDSGRISQSEHDYYVNTVFSGKQQWEMLAALDRQADTLQLGNIVERKKRKKTITPFIAMVVLATAFAFGGMMLIAGDQAVTGLVTWSGEMAGLVGQGGDAITGLVTSLT